MSGLLGPTGENIEVWLRARDSERFQADMRRSAASVESVGAAAQKAKRTGLAGMRDLSVQGGNYLKKLGGGISSVGRNIRGFGRSWTSHVTTPILALGAASAIAAVHFDRDMTQIQTQAGASAKEVAGFRKSVLAMSGRDVAQSPDELAKGLYHLRSVGLKGKDALDALKISAQGASVGNASLEETTTALGAAWLVHIKGAGNLHHTMGILNATVGAGNMRFGDLIHALGTGLLPASKVAGLGIKDTMGALAVFTDEGYQASSASAQFATALHFLYNPTNKARDAMAGIGLKGNQLAEDMHKPKGLLVALRDLRKHLDGIGGIKGAKFKEVMNPLTGKKTLAKDQAGNLIPTNKQAVKEEQVLGQILPGGRGRIMLTLLNQLDRYKQKLGQISKTSGQFGADVKRTQETPAYRLQKAWAAVQRSGVELGSILIPIIVPIFQKLSKFVEGAAKWFEKLSPAQKKVVIIAIALAAALGPVLSIIGMMTIGIGGLATALGFLAANPIVLVIAAVIALGVGLYVAYKKVKWFHDAVHAVFSFLWKHWPLLVPIVMALLGPIGVVGLAFIKLHGKVGAIVRWVKTAFNNVVDFIKKLPHRIAVAAKGMFDGIKTAFKSAINWIIDRWNGLKFHIGGGKFLGHHLPGLTIGTPNIPHLAKGGVINKSGLAVVGENGPELHWMNGGDAVSPFSATADPLRGGTLALPSGMTKGGTVAPMDPNINVQVIDKRPVIVKVGQREIGRAAANDTADQIARR